VALIFKSSPVKVKKIVQQQKKHQSPLIIIFERDVVRECEMQAFERLQGKKIMKCFCNDSIAKILSIN